jgi:hypothetical protein
MSGGLRAPSLGATQAQYRIPLLAVTADQCIAMLPSRRPGCAGLLVAGTRSFCGTSSASMPAWWRCCRPMPSSGKRWRAGHPSCCLLLLWPLGQACCAAVHPLSCCCCRGIRRDLQPARLTYSSIPPSAACPPPIVCLQHWRAHHLHQPGWQRLAHHSGQHPVWQLHQVGERLRAAAAGVAAGTSGLL